MQADHIVHNGRIYTMDRQVPLASAVAIRDGRFLAVGETSQVAALAGSDTEWLDLGGRTALPGFTDGHMHLVYYGLSLTQVQLDGVASFQEVVARVAERARMMPPGEWIRGWGWNRNLWPGAPFPRKEDLDPVTPHNPVLLSSKDGHAAWANSLALDLAGVTEQTPDPPGGELLRDPQTGQPTGLLKEDAYSLVADKAGPDTPERMEQAVRAATERLHRLGIVGVHTPEAEHELKALQSLWRKGELDLRVNFIVPDTHLPKVVGAGLMDGFGDHILRLCGIKSFADGSLGTRSADMFADYDGEPGNRGIEVSTNQQLSQIVGTATAGRWSTAIHAIGDRANARVLDALEEYWPTWSKLGLRPRIEHVQLISPQDSPRLGAMGVVASMQPLHCTSDMVMADRYWGARCCGAYAWRTLLEGGAVLCFGSDAPVEEPSVLRGIFAAVTRQREDGTPSGGWYPEQCLSAPEAAFAYTMGTAYASGEEAVKGSIRVGKLADLVVLSQDVLDIPPQEILATEVVATVLGGDIVYTTL